MSAHRRIALVAVVAAGLAGVHAGSVGAQVSPVRLAAPADCVTNPNCVPGLRRVYKVDPRSVLVRWPVADAGIQALDDGLAEIAGTRQAKAVDR